MENIQQAPASTPTSSMKSKWRLTYARARAINRGVNAGVKHDPSRRLVSLMDAARKLGRPWSSTNNGHAAAWLRTAADFRKLGMLTDARLFAAKAREQRTTTPATAA